MTSKQTTVLILGIALIALQFYAGGQWKILFGIIKKAPPQQSKGGGQSGPPPPPGRGVKPGPKTPNPHGFVQ